MAPASGQGRSLLGRRLLKALLLSIWMLASAGAAWYRVETDHFEIYTDLAVPQATSLGEDLERFRSVVTRVTTTPGPQSRLRLRVYAFASRNDFARAVSTSRIAGLYNTGPHGGVAVLHHPRGKRWNLDGRRVLLHEYVHHALRENIGFKYPAWYEEGFAEYLSTFEVDDGLGIIGTPPEDRAYVLDEFRWMPSEQLVVEGVGYMTNRRGARRGVRHGPRRAGDQTMLYALGWFTVSYLLDDPVRTQQLGDFLARLNRGEAAETAFRAAFDRSFDDFDAELRAAWRRDDTAVRAIPLAQEDAESAVRVEQLPSFDDSFWIAEAQMSTGYLPNPDRMREAYAKALDTLDVGETAWRHRIIIDQAELASDLGEPQAALDLLAGLPSDSPHRPRILFETVRGHLDLAQLDWYADPRRHEAMTERIALAKRLLGTALEEFPDDPALLEAFVRAHLLDDEADAEQALVRLGHLQAVFPQHAWVQFYAAQLYAESGRHERALESLQWESSFARSESLRAKIERVAADIARHWQLSGDEPRPMRTHWR